MLSLALLAGILMCLSVPALGIWAGPLLFVLFFTNAPVFWTAFVLSGLGGAYYFFRR